MASLTISRRLEIDASVERVWEYLTSPALLVTCLPGAALESSSADGRRHEGNVIVKLGTISVSYRGTAEFVEVDDAAHRLSVRAKGREKTGAGSAKMRMQAEVHPSSDGKAEVSLDANIDVTGKIVTLGRGMIQVVSEQVLDEFSSCLASKLVAGAAPSASGGGGTTDGPRADEERPSPRSDTVRPVNGLALLWRALSNWLRRLFGGG